MLTGYGMSLGNVLLAARIAGSTFSVFNNLISPVKFFKISTPTFSSHSIRKQKILITLRAKYAPQPHSPQPNTHPEKATGCVFVGGGPTKHLRNREKNEESSSRSSTFGRKFYKEINIILEIVAS